MKLKLTLLALVLGITTIFANVHPTNNKPPRLKNSEYPALRAASADETDVQEIVIPFMEVDSFTTNDTLRFSQVYGGSYNAKMYKFTLPNDTSIRIQVSSAISDFYFAFANNFAFTGALTPDASKDLVFEDLTAGTYYLYLDVDGDFGDYSMMFSYIDSASIVSAEDITFTPITLPYLNDSVAFTHSNGAVYDGIEMLKGYEITLASADTIYVYGLNELLGFPPSFYFSNTIFTKKLDAASLGSVPETGFKIPLEAGTYYMAFGDNNFPKYSGMPYYATYISISTDSVKPTVEMPIPTGIADSVEFILTSVDVLSAPSTITNLELYVLLTNIDVSAVLKTGDTIGITNNPFYWTIVDNGSTFTATFESPDAEDITAVVTINKTTVGNNNQLADCGFQAFSSNQKIVITGLENSKALIYDMNANLIEKVNCVSAYNESKIIFVPGLYIVYANGSTKKVMVK